MNRSTKVRHGAATATASLLLALALTGCSDDTGADDEPSGDASSETSSEETTAPEDAPTDSDADADAGTAEGPLEEFVAQVESELDESLGALAETYEDIRVEAVPPSGVEYIYVFAEPVDPDAATAQLDGSASMLESTFESQVGPGMEQAGIENPSATWTYLNPDGTEVWSRTYP